MPRSIRKRVIAGAPGSRQIRRTFEPGFRIALHQKDLNRALTSARQLGVSLPNTATAQELFNACAAHGGAAWDHSAMVRALEVMANHEISSSTERETRLSRAGQLDRGPHCATRPSLNPSLFEVV